MPNRSLPLPWNIAYLNQWYEFLRHVASRYGDEEAFRMVAAGGPTSVSDEMSLPDWTGLHTKSKGKPDYDSALPAADVGSDLKMWEALDYTPSEYIHAWVRTFRMYREIFPNQYMSLALINGLPITREKVPIHGIPVEEDGIDPGEITATPLAIIAAGMKYGSYFVLQADGLGSGSGVRTPYPYVQAGCGTIDTGFQTHAPSIEGPLTKTDLEPGVAAGVKFLEVYAITAKKAFPPYSKPAVAAAVSYAYHKLRANSGCAPLTLNATPLSAVAGTPTTVTATYETDLLSEMTFDYTAYRGLGTFPFTGAFSLKLGGRALTPTCTSTTTTTTTCTVTVTPHQSVTFKAAIDIDDNELDAPVVTATASIVR